MRLRTVNMNVVQLASGNGQLANSTCQRVTGNWLLTTGCLQTPAGRKLLGSKPDFKQQSRNSRNSIK